MTVSTNLRDQNDTLSLSLTHTHTYRKCKLRQTSQADGELLALQILQHTTTIMSLLLIDYEVDKFLQECNIDYEVNKIMHKSETCIYFDTQRNLYSPQNSLFHSLGNFRLG